MPGSPNRNSRSRSRQGQGQDSGAGTQVLDPEPAPEPERAETPAAPDPEPAPETPEETPGTPGEPEQADQPDFRAMAVSADVSQDDREAAVVQLGLEFVGQMVQGFDPAQPAVRTLRLLSGASGRGVAAARANLRIFQAMGLGGYYDGSTHDSIKGVASRQMRLYVYAPAWMQAGVDSLLDVLNSESGPLVVPEKFAYAAERVRQGTLAVADRNSYDVNRAGRRAMLHEKADTGVAARIGTALLASVVRVFPPDADDEDVRRIRSVITDISASLSANPEIKSRTLTSVIDVYDPRTPDPGTPADPASLSPTGLPASEPEPETAAEQEQEPVSA